MLLGRAALYRDRAEQNTDNRESFVIAQVDVEAMTLRKVRKSFCFGRVLTPVTISDLRAETSWVQSNRPESVGRPPDRAEALGAEARRMCRSAQIAKTIRKRIECLSTRLHHQNVDTVDMRADAPPRKIFVCDNLITNFLQSPSPIFCENARPWRQRLQEASAVTARSVMAPDTGQDQVWDRLSGLPHSLEIS